MDLESKANKQLHKFWNDRTSKFGNNFDVVGWTEDSQHRRFTSLTQLGDLSGGSLLDVGCGRGDLLTFLESVGVELDYTGFDLNAKMISFCHEIHPEKTSHFEVFDILADTPSKRFDFATCIGVLNQVTSPDSPVFAAKFIERLYSLADKAVAVSITSIHAPRKTPDTFYFDPADMLTRVSKFCTNFKIDHSYLKNDFTIFLYKD